MPKPLTNEQLNALQEARDHRQPIGVTNYRGLVARNLLRYRWGNTGAMGYTITDAGIRELDVAGR